MSVHTDFMELFQFMILVLSLLDGIARGTDENKIQSGENADITSYPFIGCFRVIQKSNRRERICTGIIVDQNTAITAGHCVIEDVHTVPIQLISLDEHDPSLIMGVTDYTRTSDPFYQERRIRQVFVHPLAEFEYPPPVEDRFDLGAMKWEQKVVFNEKISTPPLIPESNPYSVINEIIYKKSLCTIPGWGALEVKWSDPDQELTYPNNLQKADFKLLTNDECCLNFPSHYGACIQRLGEVVSGLMCHERIKMFSSTARGDSGSPVVCQGPMGGVYLVGVNAAGVGDADPPEAPTTEVYHPGYYVIYSVMDQYMRSIQQQPFAMSCSPEKSVGLYWAVLTPAVLCLKLGY